MSPPQDQSSETDPLLSRPDSNDSQAADDKYYELVRSKMNFYGVLPFLLIGMIMASLDSSIVVASYVTIGNEFKQLNNISWVATAYLLTTTAFQPLCGSLSDVLGRKIVIISSYGIFALGALLCGLSNNLVQLALARALAGIGGAGLQTCVSVVLSDLVTIRERGTWQGVMSIVFSIGLGVGAPLGGWCAETIGWRWAFGIQVPLAVISMIGLSIYLNYPPRPSDSEGSTTSRKKDIEKFKKIDYGGSFSLIVSVSMILLALDQGGNKLSWSDYRVILFIALAALFLVIFVLVEWKVAVEPLAKKNVILNRTCAAVFLSNFFQSIAHLTLMYNYPLYFQAVESDAPTIAGVRLLPAIIASSVGSLASGFFIKRFGSYYRLIMLSSAIGVVGFVLLLFLNGHNTFAEYSIYPIPAGLGIGISLTATLVAAIASAGQADQAKATGLLFLFRSVGQTFGIAGSANILQNTLRLGLTKKLNGKDANYVREDVGYIHQLQKSIATLVIDSYVDSLRYCFILALVMMVLSLIIAAFIQEENLEDKDDRASVHSAI